MRTRLIAIIIFLFSSFNYAQNLVSNGGFEVDSCTQLDFSNVTGWFQKYNADYFNTNCPDSFSTIYYKLPRTGKGFTGIYLAGSNDFQGSSYELRDYIVGSLKEPLIADKSYDVSFYVKPSGAKYNPDLMFTTSDIYASFIKDTSEISEAEVAFPNFRLALQANISNENGVIYDIEDYTRIEGCYKAKGDEKYIVIGNFNTEINTKLVPLSGSSQYKQAYFLIDDVSILEKKDIFPFTDTTICYGEKLQIQFDSIYSNIYVNGLKQDNGIVSISPVEEVLIQANQGACYVKDNFNIHYMGCNNCSFFIPNIFSPNRDGVNDKLLIASDCNFNVTNALIFDSWGRTIFQSSSTFEWDGTYNEKVLPSGVYVYIFDIEIDLIDRVEQKRLTGDIILMK